MVFPGLRRALTVLSALPRRVGIVSEETPEERDTTPPTDGLWSRLRLIEGQPLEDRAAAYSALHDDLTKRLESVPRDTGSSAPAAPSPTAARPGPR